MAAASYDNETTSTSTTSDLVGGETVTDLDNSSVNKTLEVQSDNATSGDDFTLKFAVNDADSDQDGEVIYETGDSWTATNETEGYYNYTFDHATVFKNLERDAGENVTLDVRTVVNESETSEEVAEIQIYAQNDQNSAVGVVGDGDSGLSLADSGSAYSFSLPFTNSSDEAGAAQASEDVGVNATNTTTVRLELSNASASDAGSAAISELETGAYAASSYGQFDGQFVPVFVDSADAEWLDTETDTYATIDSEGDTITYHNVNEAVDEDGTVTAKATVNDNAGFIQAWNTLGNYDIGSGERVSLAIDSLDTNGTPFDDE
ncbi:hypothetical protein [Halorubrum sp. CSM-61]|uniref:hypothetical protein n=1 Tax=Halorubrum sp. CSM-61 TaxID=2485838 RepID=UPI000F4BD06E|nr:hypothetical protein [Halorubrum sp. CSM-61]